MMSLHWKFCESVRSKFNPVAFPVDAWIQQIDLHFNPLQKCITVWKVCSYVAYGNLALRLI